MAETLYTYSIANDTLNGKVEGAALKKEIQDSTIVIAVKDIETNGDVLDITMKDALSAGDETTLTSVVGAHKGERIKEPEAFELSHKVGDKTLILNGAHTGVSLSLGNWGKIDYVMPEDLHMQGCWCNYVAFKLDDYISIALIHPGGNSTLAASANATDTSVTVATGKGVYYDPANGGKHIEFWKDDFSDLFEVREITGVSGDVVSFTPGLAANRDTTVNTRVRYNSFSSIEGTNGNEGGVRLLGTGSVLIYDSSRLSGLIPKDMVLSTIMSTSQITAIREFTPNFVFRR